MFSYQFVRSSVKGINESNTIVSISHSPQKRGCEYCKRCLLRHRQAPLSNISYTIVTPLFRHKLPHERPWTKREDVAGFQEGQPENK